MNWSLLIGPIVFLVVFAAVRGAFPRSASPAAVPDHGKGDIDYGDMPEFKSSWKDAR